MTGQADPAPDLEALLREAAGELEDVLAGPGDSGTVFTIDGRLFAVAAAGLAEFRLDPPVAAAALRTPDARPSPRGAGWVAFRPAELDRHALDRATAWLASAWRRADGEG